eukprot:CAMPEP_0181211516 /NCGR_PEP_ID=MMETSP1096-20121128/23826_1 /TAXON_ID=156174 ORGANISM="Chrysochromulina ericina, Strain CCMP281" /NCGR_SAMPLE_ID=MMETSP1096 /ASSEMBLY_ACC=CAM_ASM_000453 /LENGTH=42 /DNA_ID= /DNA_START= /DNA_END= /DNA_ORIENTATION=
MGSRSAFPSPHPTWIRTSSMVRLTSLCAEEARSGGGHEVGVP